MMPSKPTASAKAYCPPSQLRYSAGGRIAPSPTRRGFNEGVRGPSVSLKPLTPVTTLARGRGESTPWVQDRGLVGLGIPSLTLMSVKLSPMLPDVQSGTDGLAGQWAYNAFYCLILFLPLGPSPPLQPSPRGRGAHTTGGQDNGVQDHLW